MFDFGDELTIDSYRIPWLIWIQILVMFLLIILLFCFSLSISDVSNVTSSTSSSSCSNSKAPRRSAGLFGESFEPFLSQSSKRSVANRWEIFQGGEGHSVKVERPTNRRVLRADNTDRDAESGKDANPMVLHPCNYFRLAKLAFLKCLGLECLCKHSSCSEHKRES